MRSRNGVGEARLIDFKEAEALITELIGHRADTLIIIVLCPFECALLDPRAHGVAKERIPAIGRLNGITQRFLRGKRHRTDRLVIPVEEEIPVLRPFLKKIPVLREAAVCRRHFALARHQEGIVLTLQRFHHVLGSQDALIIFPDNGADAGRDPIEVVDRPVTAGQVQHHQHSKRPDDLGANSLNHSSTPM